MGKLCSLACIALGVTIRFRCSRYACWRKRTSTPQTYCTSCASFVALIHVSPAHAFACHSADLEITVPLLVQIDKLVQLIESPVFTC
jgi:hypothetical protein